MNDKDLRTQLVALFLIVFGSAAIAIGSAKGWHDLVTFALTFGGAGVGILTGQRLTQANNTTSGDIINPPAPTPLPTEGK